MSNGPQGRFSNNMPQHSRNYSGSAQQNPPPIGFSYESFQTPTLQSHGQSSLVSPAATAMKQEHGQDGDVTMEDADPYNRMKYPQRPQHQHRLSSQYVPQEESAAARRYSPMTALPPPSPYAASPQHSSQGFNAYAPQSTSARQSPTRQPAYAPPPQQYYGTGNSKLHPLQLSPMQAGERTPDPYYPNSATVQLNAMFGREVKTPRQPYIPQHGNGKGPIPRFKKLNSPQDIQPRINAQPAFRRANPEGGFISPLQALTTHLPSTYRICNPNFKYESSRNPRRVLTKPSKGVKNDGYDNEDSDYILYVNDILGNEENGHK
jgi:dual specificity protein kinase YAK1